jgi:hypothetical protein
VLLNIYEYIRVTKSRMMRWMELAVCTREMRNAHKILVQKLGTLHLGDLHAKQEETGSPLYLIL